MDIDIDLPASINLTQLVVYALAIVSIRSLIITDRITQRPRYWVMHKLYMAGGTIPVWLQWIIGCVACFGFWAALVLWGFSDNEWVNFIATVFALRQAAVYIVANLNSPDEHDYNGVPFPPLED